jgi:Fic family protein
VADREALARGTEVTIEWRGRPARAWLPAGLASLCYDPPAATVRRTERASAAIARTAGRLHAGWEHLARLLLRAEGVASSSVEGVRAPLEEVVAAEVEQSTDPSAAWVADNLDVVLDAVASSGHAPLGVASLHHWHAMLMVHSRLPSSLRGAFRDEQGWVGGLTPLDAAYVPPPPQQLPDLMEDLVVYANRFDIDPVVQAAVAHAQFETVHPYGDGNGRIGRVLVGWILARRTAVSVPPPVSMVMARDRGGYLSGLTLYRTGDVDAWVAWFAEAVEQSATAAVAMLDAVEELLVGPWDEALSGLRADATARKLVTVLPELPAVSAPVVARRLGVSAVAARGAIAALVERGVLVPLELQTQGPGRPADWFGAEALIALVRRWSG